MCFAVFATRRWSARAGQRAIGVFVAAVGAVGLLVMVRLAVHADPSSLFAGAVLEAPLGYHNASVALFTMAAIPSMMGASRPDVGPLGRGLLLGLSGLLMHLAVLTQSRGWLSTLPVIAAGALVLCPGRRRLALAMAAALGSTLVVLGPLLAVFESAGLGGPAPDLGEVRRHAAVAARSSLVAVGVLVAVGAAIALVQRRLPVPSGRARPSRRTLLLTSVLVVGAFAAPAAVVVIRTDAVSGVTRVWARFKDYSPEASTAENSRFTVAGSARYDIWRVSLEAFAHHPVKGLGQDNFAREYLQSRRDPYETQRWTHSLWLRLLVHTGAVGFALFGAFLVLALAAAFRGWKAAEDGRRVVIGAALALPLVWLVHGTIDWLWEFPALSCPALAGLGLAVALSRTSPAPERTTPEVGVLPA